MHFNMVFCTLTH
jgi:hypothetical protein